MLPVALNVVAEITLAPVILPALPVVTILPLEMLPVTDRELNVPTLVILGCAFEVTVPAVVADVALATVPVTFAPGIDVSPAPEPLNDVAVTIPTALIP